MRLKSGQLSLIVVIVCIVCILAIPFIFSTATLRLLTSAAVMIVAAASANVVTGATGQMSLGQGAFMGAGAYLAAIVVVHGGMSTELAIIPAVLIGAVLGALVGIPALRVSGISLALVGLALALVFPSLVVRFTDLTGGSDGIRVPGLEAPNWFWASSAVWVFTVCAVIAVLVLLMLSNVLRSPSGKALFGVRDNELVSEALGINARYVKVTAFVIGGAAAGLAGWMFAASNRFLTPSDFTVFLSLNILLAMYLGGAGAVYGPIVGGAILVLLPDVTRSVGVSGTLVPFILGGLLIIVLRFAPEGLFSWVRPLRDRLSQRRATTTTHS